MTIDATTYHSPNFDKRPNGIASVSSLLIHTTEGSFPSDAEWLCNPSSGVSTHFVISPDGQVYQLVNPELRAWHAGSGNWMGCTDLNDISIGIECSHVQGSAWPAPLLGALDALCRSLIESFDIDKDWVVAHRWYAPGRKTDPTDFPDSELLLFIDQLYTEPPAPPTETYNRIYRVRYNRSVVREGPARTYPVVAYVNAGVTFLSDSAKWGEVVDTSDEWIHLANGAGFIHSSAVEWMDA